MSEQSGEADRSQDTPEASPDTQSIPEYVEELVTRSHEPDNRLWLVPTRIKKAFSAKLSSTCFVPQADSDGSLLRRACPSSFPIQTLPF